MDKPKDGNDWTEYIDILRREGKSKSPLEQAVDAGNDAENAPASIFTEDSGEEIAEVPTQSAPRFEVPTQSAPRFKTKDQHGTKSLEVPEWGDPNVAYSSQSESSINQAIQHSFYKSKAAKKIQKTPPVGKYYEITCHVDAEEFEKLKGRKPDSKDRVIYCFVAPDKDGKPQILRDENGEIKKASPYDFELYNFSVEELRQRQERIDRDSEIKDAIKELKQQQAESNARAEKRIERLEELMSALADAVTRDNVPAPVFTPASQQSK